MYASARPRGALRTLPFVSGLAILTALSACQSDTRAGREEAPAVQREAASTTSGPKPIVTYDPDFGVFYATVSDPGGDPQLEPGYKALFEHDLAGATEHLLSLTARDPESKLSRAVGLGTIALTMSQWYSRLAQFDAEANLAYAQVTDERAARGMNEPLTDPERFVIARSAFYLGRNAEAARHFEQVRTEDATPWKSALKDTAGVGAGLTHRPLDDIVAGGDPDKIAEALRSQDWKTPTDGRFWDPYAFDSASRASLEMARMRFQEAASLGAELSQKLQLNTLDGIVYHLALSCYLSGHGACVSGLGPGKPGSPLAALVTANARRTAGSKPQLAEFGDVSNAFQTSLLVARISDGSPLEDRVELAQSAIDAGAAKLANRNDQLWAVARQNAVAGLAELKQIQWAQSTDASEKAAYLSAAVAPLLDAQTESGTPTYEPVYVIELALASVRQSGCQDLSRAGGMLNEQYRQRHVELFGPLWTLGGINAAHCSDPIPPVSG